MATISQSDNENLQRLVGAIVLASQDVEGYLKVIVPFMATEEATLQSVIQTHGKLQRRMLGQLVGHFVDSTTSDTLGFAQHMAQLVNDRNRIVHHFNDTYGAQLASGDIASVISSLQAVLGNITNFRSVTVQLALVIFEGLRDTTFYGTPEYEQFSELCAKFRKQVAS
ncbi:hypothetical protein [Novilysobacter luteus]|uniref:Uncharacterized protein n=1 Tax=Novilysobacter luteus TaxID=2822368 RepID=A0ABM8UDT4_9GAMM|nr:hypothetical protein [Lysobacter luteus]CAG4970763.1 hypothetical protein LYB30171_00801 [Lysobacter luteus]